LNTRRLIAAVAAAVVIAGPASAAEPGEDAAPMTSAQVLASMSPSDWRPLDEQNTLYLELESGRVIIELAPAFAPAHVANIRTLVRQKYFDGLAVIRAQDNYVVQWGDPDGQRTLGEASETLPPEFSIGITPSLPFTRLPDIDGYAPESGFSNGFPAARDPANGQAWLVHCYAMVGVGRGNDPNSGSGAELYVVIGHAPRHLDRNIALVGRVWQGMELLSALPRGSGNMGFYERPDQYVRIKSIGIAADRPPSGRSHLEVMRTDTPSFAAYVESRRNRREDWFKVPTGHVGLCNVPVAVRSP
jgi:peptidylprolyl isomerase